MRKAHINLSALLAGGFLSLAGLALSLVVAFFAMFYGLRVVCWLTGNDDWMFLMWFGIILVPAGGVLGCFFCFVGVEAFIERRRSRQPQGFDVVPDSTQRHAE
jgi:hypothetical protein